MPLMGYREYARHRDVNLNAVQDAIKRGRISDAIVEIDNKKKINSELADQLWLANRTVDKGPGSTQSIKKPDNLASTDQVTLLKSKAIKETFSAKMAQIKYEETMGNLCSVESVRASVLEMARGVRDTLLNIPDKISPILTSETNIDEVHRILTLEIRTALEGLSRGKFITEDILNERRKPSD